MTLRGTKPKNVRENNFQLLLNLYRNNSPLSVSQIAQDASLSRTTVNKINETFLEKNLILPLGKGNSSDAGGKKPNIYTLNADYGYVFCVHIQHEKIYARLFNILLETIYMEDQNIPRNSPLEHVLPIIGRFYRNSLEYIHGKSPLAVAVAVHGTVDTRRGILHHITYFPSWGTNTPMADLIREEIGGEVPIHMNNWINFKVYAEKETGIAQDLSSFILIDAGYQGVAGGAFFNGRPYVGEHFLAGEVGHMVINPYDSEACQCGGRGCLESLIFFRRIERMAVERREKYPQTTLFAESEHPNMETIINGFLHRDPLSVNLLEEIAQWLAIGLSNISLMVDPQKIIIEGEYAKAGPEFLKLLQKNFIKVSMIRNPNRPEIVFNETHSKATLIGAAAFAVGNHLVALREKL